MIKGLIFDLDGVICFTDKLHYQAWKKLADKENIYFDETINNRLKGVSRMDSLNIILEKACKTYTEDEKLAMAEYKNNIYKELLLTMTPNDMDKDSLATLIKLKKLGIKIALGSSSKNAKLILTRLNILNLFDAISDGNNITHSKPHPEVFLKAAEFLHLEPSECIVVEDAKAGIDAACAGGFKSIGLGDASRYSKTTYPINEFKDILQIIE